MTETQRPAVGEWNGRAGLDVLSRTTTHNTDALINKLDGRGLKSLSVSLKLASSRVLCFSGREAQAVLLLSAAGIVGISRTEFAAATGGLDLPAHISAIRQRGVPINHRSVVSLGIRRRRYWLSEDVDVWLEEPAQSEFWSLLDAPQAEG